MQKTKAPRLLPEDVTRIADDVIKVLSSSAGDFSDEITHITPTQFAEVFRQVAARWNGNGRQDAIDQLLAKRPSRLTAQTCAKVYTAIFKVAEELDNTGKHSAAIVEEFLRLFSGHTDEVQKFALTLEDRGTALASLVDKWATTKTTISDETMRGWANALFAILARGLASNGRIRPIDPDAVSIISRRLGDLVATAPGGSRKEQKAPPEFLILVKLLGLREFTDNTPSQRAMSAAPSNDPNGLHILSPAVSPAESASGDDLRRAAAVLTSAANVMDDHRHCEERRANLARKLEGVNSENRQLNEMRRNLESQKTALRDKVLTLEASNADLARELKDANLETERYRQEVFRIDRHAEATISAVRDEVKERLRRYVEDSGRHAWDAANAVEFDDKQKEKLRVSLKSLLRALSKEAGVPGLLEMQKQDPPST